jgi:hypothetical protein
MSKSANAQSYLVFGLDVGAVELRLDAAGHHRHAVMMKLILMPIAIVTPILDSQRHGNANVVPMMMIMMIGSMAIMDAMAAMSSAPPMVLLLGYGAPGLVVI